MKKFLALFATFIIIAVGLFLLVTSYYHIDPRFLLKLDRPPSRDISKLFPQGNDLDSNLTNPLDIEGDFRLAVFADLTDYGMPRVLSFDPNGVLLASLTKEGKVVALPDKNNDGVADEVIEVIKDLKRPHGIAFDNNFLYIAETHRVRRYNYNRDNYQVGNPFKLFDLPEGGRHFTRTIKIFDNKLYTSVGSSCDVCIEKDEKRSSILLSNLDGTGLKVYASGLRNTVFFNFDSTGKIWGNDMGRDFLGDDLPPDELNIIREGKEYGWPRCYGKRVRDGKFRSFESLEYCAGTEPTVYDYPAHVAPLGLVFINSFLFKNSDQGDLLTAFHGSWNSTVPVGYKIVKLKREGDKILSMSDFITGWLTDDNEVLGRPVDMVFDKQGIMYISDDRAGLVYILTKQNNQ